MRQQRDVADAGASRARRRRSRELLDGLELSEPFDLDAFTDQVGRKRGRVIELAAVRDAAADGSPCGWWCPLDERDVIFLDERASAIHRQHIVLHEIGHMLWGHDPVLATFAPVLQRTTSHLRWDSPALVTMLGRTQYDSPREREAEVFATMAGSTIAGSRVAARRAGDGDVHRLSQALYPPARP